MWKLGLDPVPYTSENLFSSFYPVETLSIQKKSHPVQHKNGSTRWKWIQFSMKTDQVLGSIFEFAGKGDYNELDWRTVGSGRSQSIEYICNFHTFLALMHKRIPAHLLPSGRHLNNICPGLLSHKLQTFYMESPRGINYSMLYRGISEHISSLDSRSGFFL